MTSQIDRIVEWISTQPNDAIILLRQKEVIQWLHGDLSFLAPAKLCKESEDVWGRAMLKRRRPDLKLDKQWTNKFGEHICEELLMLQGKTIMKPKTISHYQPDTEVDDAIWEAKAGTFYTSGTAGEKILGCPFKYCEVPELYGKPLRILCMGGAEKVCRTSYGNLAGARCSPQKRRFLDFVKSLQIEFVGATDILNALVGS